MPSFIGLGRGRAIKGNSGVPIPVVVTATPTPTPTPTEPTFRTAPAYLTGLPTRPTRPPDLSVTTATVTPATWASTLSGLNAISTPTIYYCQGGNYGASLYFNYHPSALVTFRAADPGNLPYFSSTATLGGSLPFQFDTASNVWFDGWEFRQPLCTDDTTNAGTGDPNDLNQTFSRIVKLSACSNMRFTRCRVRGSIGVTFGNGSGTGFALYGCDNIAFDRNTFGSDLAHAMTFAKDGTTRCTRIYSGFNTATSLGLDFHELISVDGFISEYNVRNESSWRKNDLHCDDHQAFMSGGELGAKNVWIRKHISIATAASAYTNGQNSDGIDINAQQGVFCADESIANAYPNWVVDDCWMLGLSNHAICTQAGPINWTVRGNQIVASNRANNVAHSVVPKIELVYYVGQPGENVDTIVVQDNITPAGAIDIGTPRGGAGPTLGTNVTSTPNTTNIALDDAGLTAIYTTAMAERALYY